MCVGGAQSGPFVKGKTPAHILISAGNQSGPSIVRDEECSFWGQHWEGRFGDTATQVLGR